MAKNMVAEGLTQDVTVGANVTSGQLVLAGSLFGIAQHDAQSGAKCTLQLGGVWTLPKTNAASNAFTVGAKVYWDNTNGKATASSTSNTLIGVAAAAAANTDAAANVRLNGSFS